MHEYKTLMLQTFASLALLLSCFCGFAYPAHSAATERGSEIDGIRRAAINGDAEAQWRLGVALDQGASNAADLTEAVEWFQKAMAQGNAKAHASMAMMYATGRGVPVDFALSRELYSRAAKLGEAHGFYGIGILHARGEGVEADIVEAHAWMMVASSLGDADATRLINSGAFDAHDARIAVRRAEDIRREYGLGNLPVITR